MSLVILRTVSYLLQKPTAGEETKTNSKVTAARNRIQEMRLAMKAKMAADKVGKAESRETTPGGLCVTTFCPKSPFCRLIVVTLTSAHSNNSNKRARVCASPTSWTIGVLLCDGNISS